MTRLTAALLLIGLVTSAFGQERPATRDQRIAVFVGIEPQGGFVDVDEVRVKVIKELQNELRKNRALVVAATKEQADIRLWLDRVLITSEGAGAVAMPVGKGIVALPRYRTTVTTYISMDVGDSRREMWGAGPNEKESAKWIGRTIGTWVQANRDAVLQRRAP